jgi:CspA family cold shock protein
LTLLRPLRVFHRSHLVFDVWPAVRVRGGQFFLERDEMATGTVKWFNTQKGYGFIQPEDGSKDVFVHISAVERAGLSGLNEGQRVSFDILQERGKSAAGNLKAL